MTSRTMDEQPKIIPLERHGAILEKLGRSMLDRVLVTTTKLRYLLCFIFAPVGFHLCGHDVTTAIAF